MTKASSLKPSERIIVAIDVDTLDEAEQIAEQLKDTGVLFKIGNQLGTYEGWAKVAEFAKKYGVKTFFDTKFKDIPNTVNKSSRSITRHNPTMFNIMADNTEETLAASVVGVNSACKDFALNRPIVLGVTVLTTISDEQSEEIYGGSRENKVLQFAKAAKESGLDGVVCSAQEAQLLRNDEDTKDLTLVTPGIRPEWAVSNEQKNITTPKDAINMGVDYLVIGRPITQPPPEIGTPKDALNKIIEEIS